MRVDKTNYELLIDELGQLLAGRSNKSTTVHRDLDRGQKNDVLAQVSSNASSARVGLSCHRNPQQCGELLGDNWSEQTSP